MTWKNLIVQLFASTDGKCGHIGTAYPVAKNVLLTASHVVAETPATNVRARWWHQPEPVDCDWRNCKSILWDGRKQIGAHCDVLLLECDFPDVVSDKWGILAAVRPADHKNWASVGFPSDGIADSTPVDISGLTLSAGNRSPHFALNVDGSRDRMEDWKGTSGSPVYVDGCIIGVVTMAPGKFNAGRLNAVPLHQILGENDEFRSIVGYSEAEDNRRQLLNAAHREFSKAPAEAIQALADILDSHVSEDANSTAVRLIDVLAGDQTTADPVRIAAAIVRSKAAVSESAQSCQALDLLALRLIPAALATNHIKQLQMITYGGKTDVSFRAQTRTIVELGMARLHGRAADFQKVSGPGVPPEGIFNATWPPEPEEDEGRKKLQRDFLIGLFKDMDCVDVGHDSDDDLIDAINAEIEVRQAVDLPLYYCVVQLKRNEAQKNRQLALVFDLQPRLKSFVFITLEPGKADSRELQTVSLLTKLLYRASSPDEGET